MKFIIKRCGEETVFHQTLLESLFRIPLSHKSMFLFFPLTEDEITKFLDRISAFRSVFFVFVYV